MVTSYPGGLDNLPRPAASTLMNAPGFEGDVVIDNISDAVEAIEGELGVNPSGAYSTVAARLDAVVSGGTLTGVFDVTAYGALGNDTFNNNTAFSNAMSAGAGGVVFVPEGIYQITAPITIPAGTTLTGPGTIRQMTAGAQGLTWTGSDITIENITLRGPRSTSVYWGGEYAIYAHGTSTSSRSQRFRVRNVRMHGWGAYGMYLQYVTNFEVSSCYIHDIGYTGIGVLSGEEGRITNNRIDNITPGTATNMYGIALTSGGGLEATDPRSQNIVVDGNTVSRVGWEVIETHGGMNLTFSNNNIFNCTGNAFALVGGPNNTNPTNISIIGNTVDSMVDTSPAEKQLAGLVYGNGAGYATGISITGNTFRRVEGLQTSYTRGMVIAGNTFTEISACGVTLAENNYDFAITGNTFIDMWHAVSSTAAVSTTSMGEQTGLVANNRTGRGTKSAGIINHFGLRIFINSAGRDIVVSGNNFEDCSYPYGGEGVSAIRMASGVYNVRDFGAKGDDTTNDGWVIQGALDAGAGKVVLFPPGVYLNSSNSLSVAAGTTITGQGTIHMTDLGGPCFDVNGTGVTIEGLTLRGGRNSPAYNGGEAAINVTGTSAAARYSVKIRNVEMYGWGGYGVYGQYLSKFSIRDCYIHDVGYAGIGLMSAEDGVVDGNRIDNITPGTENDMYGIFLSAGAVGSESTDPRCKRVVVSNNIVSRVLWEAVETHGGMDLTFTGNVLYDNYDCIALVGGPYSTAATNISITGNLMFNTSTAAAPQARNNGVTVAGLSNSYCLNVVISGNSFRNLRQGVSMIYTRGTVISGNGFHEINGGAINTGSYNDHFMVSGNTFTDLWHAVETTLAPVVIGGIGYESGTIIGNVLARGGKTATYTNRYGVLVMGNPTSVSLHLGPNDFSLAESGARVYSNDMTQFKVGGWRDKSPITAPVPTDLATLLTAMRNLGLIV